MAKSNFTVVRNEACPSSRVSAREGHNERKNKNPLNADIVPERAALNVHFHQNFTPDGTVETYQQTIDRLLDEKKIVKHNFKPKSAIIDELVFDVNTDYFEQNGGYEFAKKFYEEAYRLAVKEVGSEDYILSAVLHADERNKALSEHLGRDVYHYHLHVVYVPIVTKEIKWTKRAGMELAGKVKATIPQVNHTDKWPRIKVGRGYINEYSKLQDRYFGHMRAAGFDGFERGERGSTAEHLEVLEFKSQQEQKRAEALAVSAAEKEREFSSLSVEIEHRQEQAAALESKIEKKKTQAARLDKKLADDNFSVGKISEIDNIGKKNIVGQIVLTESELEYVKDFAKEGVKSRPKIAGLEQQLATVKKDRDGWKQKYERLWEQAKEFVVAFKRAPKRLYATIADIFKQPPEVTDMKIEAQERVIAQQQAKKKSYGLGR
jgi:hypothetical protein